MGIEADPEKGQQQVEAVPSGSAGQGLQVPEGDVMHSKISKYSLRVNDLCLGLAKPSSVSSTCPMAIHHVCYELGSVIWSVLQ